MKRLQDKVALVTGAGSGIGRASALAFAREGALVVVSDISARGGRETVRRIADQGGEAKFIRADVSRPQDMKQLIARTVKTFGRLDCAHNNAGVEGSLALTADHSEKDWEEVIRVNLTGVWLGMKHEIRRMLKQGCGIIVNTSSVSGMVGLTGRSAYCAAKAGVIMLTKVAALEYAKAGIRINAVCPGVTRTPMIERISGKTRQTDRELASLIPCGRICEPEEVAEAVIWLCSEAASFVTAHSLVIDGGFSAE